MKMHVHKRGGGSMNSPPVTRRHPLEPYSQSNLQSVPCDMRRFIKIATLGVGLLLVCSLSAKLDP